MEPVEQTKIFLSGPMSHRRHIDWNLPAFDDCARALRGVRPDLFIINPIEVFRHRFGSRFLEQSRSTYMRIACDLICDPDMGGILLLPDWCVFSTGSYAEAALGFAMGLPLYEYDANHEEYPSLMRRLFTLPGPDFQ